MAHIDVEGRDIELNEKGYLVKFEDWNDKVAETLAKNEGIALEQCHWEVLRFMRLFYTEFDVNPSPRIIKKEMGDKLPSGKCTRKLFDELFPGGGCKQACRLAGLPHYYCHSC